MTLANSNPETNSVNPLPDSDGNNSTTMASNTAESNVPPATTTASADENPFQEYMWMEHEDEFNRDVIQELQEDEMIDYYYELYEESLNNAYSNGHSSRHTNAGVTGPGCDRSNANETSNGEGLNGTNSTGDDLSANLDRVLTFSTLNPNAAEFVPQSARSSSTAFVAKGSDGSGNSVDAVGEDTTITP